MQQSWDVVADSLRSAPFQTAIRMYGTDESNGKTTAGRECFDMLYRKMPRIEEKLSILGFGAMRLPVNADGSVDDKTVDVMMHKAIEGGINYVDTAWPYHGGKGEDAVGRALRGGLRDKVMLVTKMPVWIINSQADMERTLDEQLKKLQTDHIDIYLLHSMTDPRWRSMQKLDALAFLERARAAGKIRYIGFSFHDGVKLFREMVDAYDWDMCQIQYNLLDRNFQAGTEGLRYAASKGIGMTIMEPLKGGILGMPVEGGLRDIAARSGYNAPNLADMSLRWVWNHPEVSVVLSGMSTPRQMEENLESADRGVANGMSDSDLKMVDDVRTHLQSRIRAACTGCSYCMPCPQSVDIPQCFRSLNDASLSGKWEALKANYLYLLGGTRELKGASHCVECGLCETKCPQHLPIRKLLKEVKEVFGV